MRELIFLDIETYPCSDEVWKEFLAIRGVKGDETAEDLAVLQGRTSLTGLARIASIGVAHGINNEAVAWTTEAQTEISLIDTFRDWLIEQVGRRSLHWVGWNIREFDAPFLAQRSLVLDRPRLALALTGGLWNPKPWEVPILDLMEAWPSPNAEKYGKNGAARGHRRQSEVCRRLGLPVQTGALGADMAQCIENGDWASVISHQLEDIRDLQRIYTRIRGAL